MAPTSNLRSVVVQRLAAGKFAAINARGGRIEFGSGDDTEFTPVELLLAAIGGCSGIDVDIITSRRAEPAEFTVTVSANTVSKGGGSHLENIDVAFDLAFADGAAGDDARTVLPQAIQRSHDRLCTVGRTVEMTSPVTMRIAGDA